MTIGLISVAGDCVHRWSGEGGIGIDSEAGIVVDSLVLRDRDWVVEECFSCW